MDMNRCEMTIKKSRSNRGSKDTANIGTTRLKDEDDGSDAATAIRELIKSMKMSAEQKITLDDGINNLAREVEAMMDGIDMASDTKDQKKLLAVYKKFLEHTIKIVNKRLKKMD
jgi:hypothetical protein